MLTDKDKLRAYQHLDDLLQVQPEIARVLASRLDPSEEPNILFRLRMGEIVVKASPGLEELAGQNKVLKQLILDSVQGQRTSIIGALISSSLRKLTLNTLKTMYLEGQQKEATAALLRIIKKADTMQISNPFSMTPEEWKLRLNSREAA